MPPIFHLEKLIKVSYKKRHFKKEKAIKKLILMLKNLNFYLNKMKHQS